MIEVSDLTKRYGDITAIDRVSFKVEQGEILGFLGPNGAGKSTTMRLLTGALGASSGRALIDGFEISEKPREAKKRFGYLPEIPPVYPEMTVTSYVEYAAQLHGVDRRQRRAAVARALEQCGLTNVAHRLVGHLSKGYQQRVGLAQALVHEPPVLILDEPTVGLDPNQITEVRKLIKSLGGKHTIILSTHILPEVQMTCQRVVIINKGRIVAQDTYENLSSQVQKNDRIALVVRRPAPDALDLMRRIDGVQSASLEPASAAGEARYIIQGERGIDFREELGRLAVQHGWGLLELSRVAVSLEEVFRELTTEEHGVIAEPGVSA
jgi:ABC-2 type transport system ATP-binding protein